MHFWAFVGDMLQQIMGRALVIQMVLLAFALLMLGCPNNAPAAVEGKRIGESCVSDLECEDALRCECSLCATPSENDRPPFCEADFSTLCEGDLPLCYDSCETLIEIAQADCQTGVPLCEAGVLFETCPADTCLGVAEPGEICIDGEFVCELGRSTLGPCYTSDCESAPIECLSDCGADFFFRSLCIASEQICEGGIPREECGACIGQPPSCVDSCETYVPVVDSICQNDAFTCSFAVGTVLATDCYCATPSLVIRSAEDLGLIEPGCVLESLLIEFEGESLVLDQLVTVENLRVVAGTLQSLSIPQLVRVNGVFEITTTNLTSLELPALEFVDEVVVISNPSLTQCQVNDAFGAASENITEIDNAPCRDGGPIADVNESSDVEASDVQEQLDGGVRD